LCPEATSQSQSIFCTSIGMWGTLWQASILWLHIVSDRNNLLHRVIQPKVLDTCTVETISSGLRSET